MKLLGIAGWKNSGKTGLVVRLIGELRSLGVRVSTVKHAHHLFEIDSPGTDSNRHREAGAGEVLIASSHHWALMHSNDMVEKPDLDRLVSRMERADLVLVEGFKNASIDKIETRRKSAGGEPLHPGDGRIVAIASDHGVADADIPVFDLDDTTAIAEFVMAEILGWHEHDRPDGR